MRQNRLGGLIYLALIGLMLALMGGGFMVILWKSYLAAKESREWPEVSAEILVSDLGERKLKNERLREFTHTLVYEYEFEGERYRHDRAARRENPFYKEEAKIKPALEKWPVGEKVTAFVNPKDPAQAVLEHDTKAAGYTIWFPGLFFIGGLGVFLGAVTKMKRLRT